METALIEQKIHRFIDSTLMRGQGADLTTSTPLFDYGILDSFALFRIINFIAEEFGIVVSIEELRAEDFATIGTITRFIDSQQTSA